MKIEILAQIQPYIDEYCEANHQSRKLNGNSPDELAQFYLFQETMQAAEKAIMQILIYSNCKEITE